MKLADRYNGANLVLLIVPEHTTTKRGWMERYKCKVPNYNNHIFDVITPNSDVLEQVRKMNSHHKNLVFVNNPLKDTDITYSDVLRALGTKKIFPNGTHLFRYKKPLHIYDSQLGKWDIELKKYLSCCS